MSQTKELTITVTGSVIGRWTVAPYSHELGLQSDVVYEVPIYRVNVGTHIFRAIRFGLVNNNQVPAPQHRICDCGLTQDQRTVPDWIPAYSPRSFRGGARPGAWRLYPGQHFLIHEGSSDPAQYIGGSLGSIEIVGAGSWNHFLSVIEKLAGATCEVVSRARALHVHVQAASYPVALLQTAQHLDGPTAEDLASPQ